MVALLLGEVAVADAAPDPSGSATDDVATVLGGVVDLVEPADGAGPSIAGSAGLGGLVEEPVTPAALEFVDPLVQSIASIEAALVPPVVGSVTAPVVDEVVA